MIFYTAVEPGTLHTRIVGTQTDARAINRNFTQIDIPTGKPELMAWANDMQRQIDELRDALSRAAVDEPNGNSAEFLEPTPLQPRITSNDGGLMGTAPILAGPETEIMELDAARLAPIVERAVERVGELGETAFEAIDGYQAGNGVGGSFSRGVHILSVLCAGEHQLTRMLFRARKKTNWSSMAVLPRPPDWRGGGRIEAGVLMRPGLRSLSPCPMTSPFASSRRSIPRR